MRDVRTAIEDLKRFGDRLGESKAVESFIAAGGESASRSAYHVLVIMDTDPKLTMQQAIEFARASGL